MPNVYYEIPGQATAVNDEPTNPPLLAPWVPITFAAYQASLHALYHSIAATLRDRGIGEVKSFLSTPTDYLVCDGAAFLTNDYPELHAVLQLAGLPPNNTPDLRDRFVAGVGPQSGVVGATGGTWDHDHGGVLGAHTHSVDPPNTISGTDSPPDVIGLSLLGVGTAANDNHTHAVNIPAFNSGSAAGSPAAQDNPPFYALVYAIRAR